jgi:hypothetical protein
MLRKLPLLADRHTLEAVTRTLGLWDTLVGLVRQGNPISGRHVNALTLLVLVKKMFRVFDMATNIVVSSKQQ